MINRICISINNRCNLGCKYCHFHEKGILDDADMDVFKILDNVKTYAKGNFKIGFVGNGEGLLDWPKLKSYIAYLEDYPNISIYTITNGTVPLDDEDWRFLENHSVNVGFSIDGYKELHDKNRGNSFDKAMHNDDDMQLSLIGTAQSPVVEKLRGVDLNTLTPMDKHVAELIAAGEVVERPSSVIKELVENAIDAGAKNITVEIKNGGATFMRVTDDGCGIQKDDVRTAFLRHATSKVRLEEDLDRIATLGFRGEALASISAVSRLQLITRSRDESVGSNYVIEGGEEIGFDDAGCPVGTTFVIRDLFYNIPARAKFLKKDVSEGNAVANVIDKVALSHPEIAFTFIRDGKQALKTFGDGKLISAIYAVFGREFAGGLIPVDYQLDAIGVRGYVSKPVNSRPNRNMQNFFINGRYVKSRTAMAALEEAFKHSVMVGKFPSCVRHSMPYTENAMLFSCFSWIMQKSTVNIKTLLVYQKQLIMIYQ